MAKPNVTRSLTESPSGSPTGSSAAAVKRPPAQSPKAPPELPPSPAGVRGGYGMSDDTSGLLGVAVEFERRRGRGAISNASGRYEPVTRVAFDDGWRSLDDLPRFMTEVQVFSTRKIITRNQSPDIGFDRSINPYRGCEHGCIYCFARPTHAYLGLSPGLDFESKLFVKPDAAELLEKELADPKYSPRVLAIGTNTDPYQPIERRYQVMRRILEVLDKCSHPVGIVTKSALVLRDLDILARMAQRNLVKVALSVTTLDPQLARKMEPRAATPMRRLETLRRLSQAGVPTAVMVAPIVPAINDMDIERILEAARVAGVKEAGYVLLRLPLEVRDLFQEWVREHFPDRAEKVFKIVRETRGGKDYDAKWFTRQKGTGPYAWLIGRRFQLACEKLGLNERKLTLDTSRFTPPKPDSDQLQLFA
jgi:DNA repair photolyase